MTPKEARSRQREERRTAMERQRSALASGDERYLPARHKGPVRKYARDFVDSRFCIAEYFLPMAVIILVLSMVRVGSLQNIALLLWLFVIVAIVIDSALTGFRLKKKLAEKFRTSAAGRRRVRADAHAPDEAPPSAQALQVKRGERP